METFKVPVEVVFTGNLTVRAENRIEARKLVLNNFSASIDHYMHNQNQKIVNWNMQVFSKDIRFKRRITLLWPKRK
jgi:Neuraminidase (sialidase)